MVNGIDYGQGDRPKILTEAEFEDMLAILASNVVPGRGRKAQTSTAVTIVKCGVCGAGVELTAEKDGTRVLRCSQRGGGVRHPTARAAIVEDQLAFVALLRVLQGRKAGDRDDAETSALRLTLARAKERRDRARRDVDAYEDEDDRDYARQRVAALTAEVRAARVALDDAMTADVAGRARALAHRAVADLGQGAALFRPAEVFDDFRALWAAWPIADRRELLRGRELALMPATQVHPKYRLRVDGRTVPRVTPDFPAIEPF